MTTEEQPTVHRGTDSLDNRTDQNDNYSLKVKADYIVDQRPKSLPPLVDYSDGKANQENGTSEKGKRSRGQNKKRPRDKKIDSSDKVCLAIIRGDTCPFGNDCRFSHDLKEFMATRPEDIKELDGQCPQHNLYGYCKFGAMCRVGSSHINMATGENKAGEPIATESDFVSNFLSTEIQIQLRRNTYPFVCKRHFEKKGKKEQDVSDEVGTETVPKPQGTFEAASTQVNMSPLPTKTRKLIDFSNKVYVAPLTTVGNLPFRRVMKKFGADITCGEMALATNLLEGKASEWALLKRHRDEDVFGIQIAAGYPDQFTRVSELIEAHASVDFVDLNLGCPLDFICNKGAGSGLMMREKRLHQALVGITNTLSCPVTIKMRTGWDIQKPFARELVSKIQSWKVNGINSIMVHGRSRLQRYSKEADWDYISMVAAGQSNEDPKIPIIGNGDIFSFVDYEEKIDREGVASCAMLARGALIKPWLPTEIKERRHWDISASDRLDILKDFVKFGLEHWGTDQQGVNNCRRFLLEWLSFLHRYVPVGLLERVPQQMNQRPPAFMCGRNDLETLMLSDHSSDWIKISEMLLGPVPEGFRFEPKHKARGYV